MAYEPLEEYDYEILKFINRFESVPKDKIIQEFNGKIQSIEYRLSLLETPDYKSNLPVRIPISNSSYIESEFEVVKIEHITHHKSTNIYYLTDFGKRALQDYIQSRKKDIRLLWLKNCWIPMLVSIVTTLTTIGLTQLIPMMLSQISK
ncbi:hypothetical protein [Lacrimispora sp.]|uniref:hypothetical protein n=1 Tax=Lacrimispora sp. TaxID=2719234 RepID=UPI003460719F